MHRIDHRVLDEVKVFQPGKFCPSDPVFFEKFVFGLQSRKSSILVALPAMFFASSETVLCGILCYLFTMKCISPAITK
jgi:hypothetical protein